jgi:hypothetical protein
VSQRPPTACEAGAVDDTAGVVTDVADDVVVEPADPLWDDDEHAVRSSMTALMDPTGQPLITPPAIPPSRSNLASGR